VGLAKPAPFALRHPPWHSGVMRVCTGAQAARPKRAVGLAAGDLPRFGLMALKLLGLGRRLDT